MTQVIHYMIFSRVNWFLDLAACVCRLPWLADIFPPLFHRQSEFTMQTFRVAHFPLICNSFFYSYLVCIFVSFHYVHIFQWWSNKVLLDLTRIIFFFFPGIIEENSGSIKEVIFVWQLWPVMSLLLIATFGFGFLEPTLSIHLEKVGFTEMRQSYHDYFAKRYYC